MILNRPVAGQSVFNCHLASTEASKEGMIIQTGQAESNRILGSVEELGLQAELILLTLRHAGHVCIADELNSLNKLLSLPDGTIVFPDHGPDTTIGTIIEPTPFLHG